MGMLRVSLVIFVSYRPFTVRARQLFSDYALSCFHSALDRCRLLYQKISLPLDRTRLVPHSSPARPTYTTTNPAATR